MTELTKDWQCEACEQPEEVTEIKSVIGMLYISICLNPNCEYSTVLRVLDSPTFEPEPTFPCIDDLEMEKYFKKKKSA